jgi:hypothetical protein
MLVIPSLSGFSTAGFSVLGEQNHVVEMIIHIIVKHVKQFSPGSDLEKWTAKSPKITPDAPIRALASSRFLECRDLLVGLKLQMIARSQ